MSKTIKFFNVSILLNDEKTNLSFLHFIDAIARQDWNNRLRKIDSYPTGVISLFPMDEAKRIIPIGKYRQDYKPYIGDVSTQRLNAIDHDVVELVTMLYDESYQALAMDYSQHGLKQSGIEKYLSSFLPQSADEYWQVKLYPIYSRRNIDVIRNTRQIRSIEITLNLSRFNTLVHGQQRNQNRLLTQFINNISNTKNQLDANTLKMEFVSSSSPDATMNLANALALIEMLDNGEEYINKLKVKYRDNRTEIINMVDLKNFGGQLKDTILKDSTNKNPLWNDVGVEIANLYNNYDATINEAYQLHRQNIIEVEQPGYILEPRDIHRVNQEEN